MVVERDGVFRLPDEPIAGCAPDLAAGLAPTLDDVSEALLRWLRHAPATPPVGPGHPVGPVPDGVVRTRVPLVLEVADDRSCWVAAGDGDARRCGAATASVLVRARRGIPEPLATSLLEVDAVSVDELCDAGLLGRGPDAAGPIERRILREQRAHLRVKRRLRAEGAPDGDRIAVSAVWCRAGMDDWLPLALGYLVAIVRSEPTLDRRFEARLEVADDPEAWARSIGAEAGRVFLFSNYVWNVEQNQALSRRVKEAGDHLTIHGGPSVPRYDDDRADFLAANPHVDVLVHGEGEATFRELLERLTDLVADSGGLEPARVAAALAGTPGTTVRVSDGVVVGPPRPRLSDLDTLPSPFLDGVFDPLLDAGLARIVLETNRGCPFGCTFCDWGSATNSRIRTFDLERIRAELSWVSERPIEFLILADANFGMLPRDVEIADFVADRYEATSSPARFGASMTKNPGARYHRIIDRLVGVGLLPGAGLSLQTYDRQTLGAVDRANLTPEKYDATWSALRDRSVSMGAEFMVGLPGATRASFRRDLQFSVDRELQFLLHRTALLPNAPMNAPAYRKEHAIVADDDGLLVETSTYRRSDLVAMLEDYQAVYGADHLGALRVVLRFVRHRTGRTEVDTAATLAGLARDRPEAFAAVRWFLTGSSRWGAVPPGWDRFLDQVRRLLVEELAVEPDGVFTSALAAQRAMLPHVSRSYPVRVELDHDVGGWCRDIRAAGVAGEDWTDVVDDLSTYGPAVFEVDDPWDVRLNLAVLAQPHGSSGWEMRSPFARPNARGSEVVV